MSAQFAFRWNPPQLAVGASRADRRRRDVEVARAKQEIRWVWNEFCSGADLARRIVPASTFSRVSPRIGPITLENPTRFSVELTPGQRLSDFRQHQDRLAAAFRVPAVDIADLAPGWISVVLLESAPDADAEGPVAATPGPVPAPQGRVRHWSLRGKGPAGRPRTLR